MNGWELDAVSYILGTISGAFCLGLGYYAGGRWL